jgi:O-6-methylguanine DNA methyltransferase
VFSLAPYRAWTIVAATTATGRVVGLRFRRDATLDVTPRDLRELLPSPRDRACHDSAAIEAFLGELDAYFSGRLQRFRSGVDFAGRGTGFQRRVWEELRRIPHGSTLTYGELAARLGVPRAARAVGQANGRNPIPIVVPCHRVVAANGRLGGFTGGVDIKEFLLGLERARRTRPDPVAEPT